MTSRRTNDLDLRVLVVDALLSHGVPRDAIRHEITLDSASSDGRADIVVALDREIIGIEIKSGKDKLDRLETQREQYGCRFDKMCAVIDARHVPTGLERWQVSNWFHKLRFGAVAVAHRNESGALYLETERTSSYGVPWEPRLVWERDCGATARQSPHAMLSMLWAGEASSIAAKLVQAGHIRPFAGDQRYRVIPHLAEHTSIALLRPLIAETLRARQLNKWEERFWADFDARKVEVAA